MNIVKAPNSFIDMDRPWIFLAGSIEMGSAVDWQAEITAMLSGAMGTILNPRRDDWDSSWVQAADNPQFREQVLWELRAQEEADKIGLYFAPGTNSPITLLELGLFRRNNMTVCCPEGFWLKGNVDLVCQRYDISTARDINELAARLVA